MPTPAKANLAIEVLKASATQTAPVDPAKGNALLSKLLRSKTLPMVPDPEPLKDPTPETKPES